MVRNSNLSDNLIADVPKEKLKNAKPNLSVLKEYRKREEEFLRRAQDFENITKARDSQKQNYEALRKQRLDEFMTGFNTISFKLKEMYQVCLTPFSTLWTQCDTFIDDHSGWKC